MAHGVPLLAAVALFTCAAYVLTALLSFSAQDPGWTHVNEFTQVENWLGMTGAWLADVLLSVLGYGAYMGAFLLIWWGIWLALMPMRNTDFDPLMLALQVFGAVAILLAACALSALYLYHTPNNFPFNSGGLLGESLLQFLWPLLGTLGVTLLFFIALLAGWVLLTGVSWFRVMDEIGFALVSIWNLIQGQWYELEQERQELQHELAHQYPSHEAYTPYDPPDSYSSKGS